MLEHAPRLCSQCLRQLVPVVRVCKVLGERLCCPWCGNFHDEPQPEENQ